MSQAIETYLERVMACAKIDDPEQAASIRAEQRDHLEEKIERQVADGLAREDAVFRAIDEHGDALIVGYGLRPAFPLVDIRARGTARGVIAIGPKAVGVFAFGGCAIGVFAFGGLAAGIFTIGGLTAALLLSWGGLAVVPCGIAYAGVGLAPIAIGGVAIGIVAFGGQAIGMLAEGGVESSRYTMETAPDWMRNVVETAVPTMEHFATINIVMVGMMIALLIVSNVPVLRETRRVERIVATR